MLYSCTIPPVTSSDGSNSLVSCNVCLIPLHSVYELLFVNEKILPAISVNKECCSHQAFTLQPPGWMVSPEGTQDGRGRPPPNHQTLQPPPMVHPEETQDEKAQDTGPRELR